jgi:hypothetical protein
MEFEAELGVLFRRLRTAAGVRDASSALLLSPTLQAAAGGAASVDTWHRERLAFVVILARLLH